MYTGFVYLFMKKAKTKLETITKLIQTHYFLNVCLSRIVSKPTLSVGLCVGFGVICSKLSVN